MYRSHGRAEEHQAVKQTPHTCHCSERFLSEREDRTRKLKENGVPLSRSLMRLPELCPSLRGFAS